MLQGHSGVGKSIKNSLKYQQEQQLRLKIEEELSDSIQAS